MKLPNCFLQNRFIFINHVICFRQNRVLEEWISIKIKIKLESFWIVDSGPFNIFEELQGTFITLRNLVTNYNQTNVEITENCLRIIINRKWNYISTLTSSASTSLFFIAVSQKLGTPFSAKVQSLSQ